MKPTLQDRLLRRELGQSPRYTAVDGLYGDRSWVEDLDIVNELGGHSGCVNALRYSIAPSVSEQSNAKHPYTVGPPRVRQFDLRLPSSAYPRPKGGRGTFARREQHDDSIVPPPLISYKRYRLDLNTISCSATQPHYIALGGAHLHCFLHDRRMLGRDRVAERGTPGSVTPTGGMSPVDDEVMGEATRCVRRFAPNGKSRMRRTDNGHITACKISDANPNELIGSWSGDQIYSFDILRSPAAADADPKRADNPVVGKSGKRAKESADRKRKRKQGQTSTSPKQTQRSPRPRHMRSPAHEAGDLALRVRYENGQSEDIAMDDPVMAIPGAMAEDVRESVLTESQKRSLRIARSVVKIRKLMFSLSDSSAASNRAAICDPSPYTASFTSVLGLSARVIPEMDEISRTWRYPLDPLDRDIVFQHTLRGHRDSSRRFVQAAGTLAKTLGGRLQTGGSGPSPLLHYFQQIDPAPHEGPYPSQREVFSLDFLKAILLWLDGGPESLLQGFKKSPNQRKDNPRFPIPEEADHAGIDDHLIPYLLRMATSRSIPNVDASRFERDESRQVFDSESSAVIAFSSAIRMPLKDLSRAIMPAGDDPTARETPVAQDRKAASKFWGFKVGRGILMNAGEGVNYQYVDVAFGGLGTTRMDEGRVQEDIEPDEMEDVVETVSLVQQQSTEKGDETQAGSTTPAADWDGQATATELDGDSSVDLDDASSDANIVLVDDLHDEIGERMAEHYEHEGQLDDGDDDGDDIEQDNDDAGDSDQDITDEERQFVFRLASDRGKSRESVEADVPYSSHTRAYSGHCNVKTVKDANFFGLNDEYVVSGSDGGHLFIWDKKTSELVNILQGDEEVVNIFSPDNRAQDDARAGINVGYASNGFTVHSSLSGRRRAGRRAPGETDNGAAEEGLASRKRYDQREEIIRENDLQRQGGMREAFITRGMLAQLSARLRARQASDGDDDGPPIMIDDNCEIM
ncbi:MAG: hypothetical protein Q9201_001885 [Fulgogasparrea decipioides]